MRDGMNRGRMDRHGCDAHHAMHRAMRQAMRHGGRGFGHGFGGGRGAFGSGGRGFEGSSASRGGLLSLNRSDGLLTRGLCGLCLLAGELAFRCRIGGRCRGGRVGALGRGLLSCRPLLGLLRLAQTVADDDSNASSSTPPSTIPTLPSRAPAVWLCSVSAAYLAVRNGNLPPLRRLNQSLVIFME